MSRTPLVLVLAGVAGLALTPRGSSAQTSDLVEGPRAFVVVLVQQLNVRQEPDLEAPVVGVSVRGDTLCVATFEADWVEVSEPREGVSTPTLRGFVSRGLVSEVRAAPTVLEEVGCR